MALASYAAFFANPDLADAEVRFTAPAAAPATSAAAPRAPPRLLAALPAHRIVLKPASERWAAELERWTGCGGSGGGGGGVPAVTIGLAGPEELPLGRAMVKALYSGQLEVPALLSPEASPEAPAVDGAGGGEEAALLRLLELAHCSLLAGVVGLACARLAALAQGGRLSWDAVTRLLSAPEDLASSREFTPLRADLASAVRARLGNLEAALNDAPAITALAALPAAALAGLLGGGGAAAAGEASAVAAANAWVAARGGAANVAAEDCAALLRCVRVDQLAPTYRALALPNISWVVKSGASVQLAQAVALLALPPELSELRREGLAAYPSLRRWARHWLGRGPRARPPPPAGAAAAAGALRVEAPAVGEERLASMFRAAQARLAAADAAAAGAGAAAALGPREAKPPKRRRAEGWEEGAEPRRRRAASAPASQDGDGGDDGDDTRPPRDGGRRRAADAGGGPAVGAGEEEEEEAEEEGGEVAVRTTFFAGFHWHCALRWAPVGRPPPAPRGGRGRGRGRGGGGGGAGARGAGPVPLRLELSLSASHAWCRRGVPLELRGASARVDSLADAAAPPPPARGGGRGGRGAAAGAARLMAAGAGAPPAWRAAGGAGDAGGGPAPGGGEAPCLPRELVFSAFLPVHVSEWVSDWEGREGMPLALLPYLGGRGGALRASVAAAEIV
ncbi:hypothetical protein Rsub_09832 [Raphidocelis subcapitata]|uniref:Uncharacterized protein n=1 Tax=Raphidocelis subcapitata TaxID=307507 RepID=A0A2V0PF36_9CHLO|nr:hypothetical protein Rsub_09832 [Raphidocelis subcapitata]|eukprot:GBF96490.1 hypothetical protein Rsub_09832 [Raphidocelis subcapitata]